MLDDLQYFRDRFYTDRDGEVSVRLRLDEISDFSRDWIHQLAPGETILASEWECDAGGVGASGHDGKVTTVWLSQPALNIVAPAGRVGDGL